MAVVGVPLPSPTQVASARSVIGRPALAAHESVASASGPTRPSDSQNVARICVACVHVTVALKSTPKASNDPSGGSSFTVQLPGPDGGLGCGLGLGFGL